MLDCTQIPAYFVATIAVVTNAVEVAVDLKLATRMCRPTVAAEALNWPIE